MHEYIFKMKNYFFFNSSISFSFV